MPVAPQRVRPGDTVAVCAPAGPVDPARLRAGLDKLASRYRVSCTERVYETTGYLAGTDEARADELNGYLRDPDVRAIIMGRGGYGTMRILDRLDADALRNDPKPIVGFSDGTALLAWALMTAGVRGIHGPVVSQLGRLGRDEEAWLYNMLESTEPAGPTPWELAGAHSGLSHEGRLVGGNLCMISHLLATGHQLPSHDMVLFIEDIGERPYAIDRYVTHMRNAGALDGLACVVAGDFTDCVTAPEKPEAQRVDVLDVLAERFASINVPLFSGLPVGHGAHNYALPVFAKCVVDTDDRVLAVRESAVQ